MILADIPIYITYTKIRSFVFLKILKQTKQKAKKMLYHNYLTVEFINYVSI